MAPKNNIKKAPAPKEVHPATSPAAAVEEAEFTPVPVHKEGGQEQEHTTNKVVIEGRPGRALVEKLCAVMAEIKQIEKTGYNDHHKYHYATESDVVEVLRPKLAAHGIVILPSQEEVNYRDVTREKGDKVRRTLMTQVKMSYLITDGESSFTVYAYGQSEDGDDKGIYKAVTGATKYFHMKTFMIATGDDPERDSAERNGDRADDKLPLPANGLIQDVVVSVSCETKQGGASGTFVVCTVETSKYGKFECYESVGRVAEQFAGTGVQCNMSAEKSKYGPKLKSITEVVLTPGEKAFNEVKAALEKVENLDQLATLKGKFKDKGGDYWTRDTVEAMRAHGVKLGAPEKKDAGEGKAPVAAADAPAAPAPEPDQEPARLSAYGETWKRRVGDCKKHRDFYQLEKEFEEVDELKNSPECRTILTNKGAELGIEGYTA